MLKGIWNVPELRVLVPPSSLYNSAMLLSKNGAILGSDRLFEPKREIFGVRQAGGKAESSSNYASRYSTEGSSSFSIGPGHLCHEIQPRPLDSPGDIFPLRQVSSSSTDSGRLRPLSRQFPFSFFPFKYH